MNTSFLTLNNYCKFKVTKFHFLCCTNNTDYFLTKKRIIYNNIRYIGTKSSFKNQTEIYSAPLAKKVRNLKYFTLATSILGIAVQYGVWGKMAYQVELTIPQLASISAMFGIFNFVIPILIHMVTRKYVTKVYHDPVTNNYTLLVYTIFVRNKPITFTPNDVKETNFGTLSTTIIKNRAFFLNPDYFTDINYYKNIMGYDKPINYFINDPELELDKKESNRKTDELVSEKKKS